MSELVDLYKQLSDLTVGECAKCRVPHSCCDTMYCAVAQEFALDVYGVRLEPTDHPTLPFMSENGCIVPPHLRPMCTRHTCDINGLGFKRGDPAWTKFYFDLVDRIDTIEANQVV